MADPFADQPVSGPIYGPAARITPEEVRDVLVGNHPGGSTKSSSSSSSSPTTTRTTTTSTTSQAQSQSANSIPASASTSPAPAPVTAPIPRPRYPRGRIPVHTPDFRSPMAAPPPRPTTNKKSKKYDVIDELDPSGAAGWHHEGPFDAARHWYAQQQKEKEQQQQQQNSKGDDSSSLSSTSSAGTGGANINNNNNTTTTTTTSSSNNDRLQPRQSSRLSARAQATLNAMSNTYPPSNSSRRNSNSSSVNQVELGYPMPSTGKGDQLIQAFGIVNNEAWEDYGNRRYDSNNNTDDENNDDNSSEVISRSQDGKLSRNQRDMRVASVWDMEATLREGKPVGATNAPPVPAIPAVPAIPPEFANQAGGSGSNSNTPLSLSDGNSSAAAPPKRSKSLIQRIRRDKSLRRRNNEDPSTVTTTTSPSANGYDNNNASTDDFSNSTTPPQPSLSSKPTRSKSAKARSNTSPTTNAPRPVISAPISPPVEAGIFADSNAIPIPTTSVNTEMNNNYNYTNNNSSNIMFDPNQNPNSNYEPTTATTTTSASASVATSSSLPPNKRLPSKPIPPPQQVNVPTAEEFNEKLYLGSSSKPAPAPGLGRKTSIMDRFKEGFGRRNNSSG